jgi:hypothetical protein
MGSVAPQHNLLLQHSAAAPTFTQQQNGLLQHQDPWRDLRGGFEPHPSPQQQQQQQQHQQQYQPVLQLPPVQPPQPPPDPQPNKADLVNMRCEIWCESVLRSARHGCLLCTWRRAAHVFCPCLGCRAKYTMPIIVTLMYPPS